MKKLIICRIIILYSLLLRSSENHKLKKMTTYKKKPGNAAFSRREFFQKSGIMLAGIGTIGVYSCFKPASKKELRIIAYNVLKCTGYPSEKMTNKDQMPTLMAKELAKYNPDIINFSE